MEAFSTSPPPTAAGTPLEGSPAGGAGSPARTGPKPRRGFTLVEMLAVIVIIGILTSLITAAAIAARRRARIAAIVMEISQLDLAVKAYKEKFGFYPPDFTEPVLLNLHVRRAFPRFVTGAALPGGGTAEAPPGLDPAQALRFWLAGHDGKGLSADPRNPFASTPASRIPPMFAFDQTRLAGHLYYPVGFPVGSGQPYVYFRARPGGYGSASGSNPQQYNGCIPCGRYDNNNTFLEWVNPQSFQIRCAGLDGVFGTSDRFPAGGAGYPSDQFDDMGNFCPGTFEDASDL